MRQTNTVRQQSVVAAAPTAVVAAAHRRQRAGVQPRPWRPAVAGTAGLAARDAATAAVRRSTPPLAVMHAWGLGPRAGVTEHLLGFRTRLVPGHLPGHRRRLWLALLAVALPVRACCRRGRWRRLPAFTTRAGVPVRPCRRRVSRLWLPRPWRPSGGVA